MENLHLAMFGVYWSSASEDIISLIFHVTSQDHVIEGSCDHVEAPYFISPPSQVCGS